MVVGDPAHLNGLVGAKAQVTLEIHAEIPDGAPEDVVRTVMLVIGRSRLMLARNRRVWLASPAD